MPLLSRDSTNFPLFLNNNKKMKCRWHPNDHFTQTHLSHLPGRVQMRPRKSHPEEAFSLYYSILSAQILPTRKHHPPSLDSNCSLVHVSIRCRPTPGNPSYYEAEAGGSQKLQSKFKVSQSNLSKTLPLLGWDWAWCHISLIPALSTQPRQAKLWQANQFQDS